MHLIMSLLGNKWWSVVFLGWSLYFLAFIKEGLLSFKHRNKQKVTHNEIHGWSSLSPHLDENKLRKWLTTPILIHQHRKEKEQKNAENQKTNTETLIAWGRYNRQSGINAKLNNICRLLGFILIVNGMNLD